MPSHQSGPAGQRAYRASFAAWGSQPNIRRGSKAETAIADGHSERVVAYLANAMRSANAGHRRESSLRNEN